MAESATFCISGAVLDKAGGNVSGAFYVDNEAERNRINLQAESLINVETRKDWTAVYSGLSVKVKSILEDAASCWAAIELIKWDMSGYTSRIEAEDLINVLWAKFRKLVDILKDQKSVTFISGA